jgi:hypothetical protein
MRVTFAVGLLACCSLSAGCGDLLVNTVRNLRYEFALGAETVQEDVRDCLVADATWKEFQAAHPEHDYSADFARGFKDGYWDFLEEGGSGQPPPLPPKVYWEVRYQTPQGHAAVADWFAGFREGAAAARESGERQLVVVPSALPPPAASPATAGIAPAPAASGETPDLPSPRKLMPEALPAPEAKPNPLPPTKPKEARAQPKLPPEAISAPEPSREGESLSAPGVQDLSGPAFIPAEWLNAIVSWPGFMG